MLKRFFENKTDWLPFVTYNCDGTDYILFVRKGKSGMLYFKTKNTTPFGKCTYNFRKSLLEIQAQFDKIMSTPI